MFSELESNPHQKEGAFGAGQAKHERQSHRRRQAEKPGHPQQAEHAGGAGQRWEH